MSTLPRRKNPPVIVETPRGLARVVSECTNPWGLKIVNVRFLNTGSPWTFEQCQVKPMGSIK